MAFNRKQIIEFPVSSLGQVVGFAVLTAAIVIWVVPRVNTLIAKRTV